MSQVKRQRLDDSGHHQATVISDEGNSKGGPHPHPPRNASPSAGVDRQSHSLQRSLFVRSLPKSVNTEGLTDLFSEKYPVKHATVVVDPSTKTSKGYGFITLADPEDIESAINDFHNHLFEGNKIRVELANPRQRREPKVASGVTDGSDQVATSDPGQLSTSDSKPATSSRLIVRNLPWTIKEEDELGKLFRSYGKIKQVSIPKKGQGLSAGFGFVLLRGRKNAEKALEGVNGKVIEGRTLAVDWAVDKKTWEGLKSEHKRASSGERSPSRASEADVAENKSNESSGAALSDEEQKVSPELLSDLEDLDQEDSNGSSPRIGPEDQTQPSIPSDDNSTTVFVRNLPFSATDDSLYAQFHGFGAVKYARIVMDHGTGMSKGTGFVSFYNESDANTCVREAPQSQPAVKQNAVNDRGPKARSVGHSVLEDITVDPSGRYIMEGRVLQVSAAVSRIESNRLTLVNHSQREARDKDKRRLFLLTEGAIASNTPLGAKLSATEMKMREDSLRQRQNLVKNNPSLHLSLTRLSIRNLPRSFSSKALKALAREAVVGYAKDVKAGLRKQLSKDEVSRGGEDMREAEKSRKAKGKGIVKQAKIIFEGREGGKVAEDSGAGRSRGYGFVEYSSHRCALMGLRWLNGHFTRPSASDVSSTDPPGPRGTPKGVPKETGKHLIAEFALENAQVVARRRERELRVHNPNKDGRGGNREETAAGRGGRTKAAPAGVTPTTRGGKVSELSTTTTTGEEGGEEEEDESAKRQRIIGRKRMARKMRNKK